MDREYLRLAKIMHDEQAEKGVKVQLDRVKIRRFKKVIR